MCEPIHPLMSGVGKCRNPHKVGLKVFHSMDCSCNGSAWLRVLPTGPTAKDTSLHCSVTGLPGCVRNVLATVFCIIAGTSQIGACSTNKRSSTEAAKTLSMDGSWAPHCMRPGSLASGTYVARAGTAHTSDIQRHTWADRHRCRPCQLPQVVQGHTAPQDPPWRLRTLPSGQTPWRPRVLAQMGSPGSSGAGWGRSTRPGRSS